MFLVALLLSLSNPNSGAGDALWGWLVDPEGVSIEGAVLLFEPLDGQPPARFAAGPTDASGAWTLEGLAPGRWRPRLRHFGPDLGGAILDPAELVLPSSPQRLTARVARISLAPDGWEAFCVQVPDPLRSLEWGEHLGDPLQARSWLVRQDARLVVGMWSKEHGLFEVEHVFRAQAPWSVHLRAEQRLERALPGHVEVLLPRPSSSLEVTLRVLAPRSRRELLAMSPTLGPDGSSRWAFRFSLPPGEYLLAAGERETTTVCLAGVETSWERHAQRTIEVPVRVDAGTRQTRELDWEACVRPTLRFDAPAARAIFVWELDAEGRIARPVGCEPRAPGIVLGDLLAWPNGSAHPTREPLPVGRVRLIAGADGFAPREFELDLVEGAPLEARIELSALERKAE